MSHRAAPPDPVPDAILGTNFFSDSAPDDFGRFDLAMVAMFRVTAGMGWIESLPWAGPDGAVIYANVAFVASYVIIANWTLLQANLRPCKSFSIHGYVPRRLPASRTSESTPHFLSSTIFRTSPLFSS